MKTARMGCFGFMAACLLIIIVVALIPDAKKSDAPERAAAASSDPVQFDPQEAIHKAQLNQMEANAGACMERAMHGLLMEGIRDRSQLIGFAKNTCGAPLKRFLISLGTPEKAADAWIQKDAEDVLAIELK